MTVLDRSDLEASSLADLHAIASQLGLDGYRRLLKRDLVDRILERGGGEAAEAPAVMSESEVAGEQAEDLTPGGPRRRPARRRGGATESEPELHPRPGRGRRRRAVAVGSAGERDRDEEAPRGGEEAHRGPSGRENEPIVEGVIELLANGSAFLTPDSDSGAETKEEVYVAAAQVRRCELASGDRVSGPVRGARRSERHPSLVRVDTVNGEPAEAVLARPRLDSLPAAFPTERLELGSEDPTLKAIEWLTPIGRGSRVSIVGAARAGKTETLRALLGALAKGGTVQPTLVLSGVRPEEVSAWQEGPVPPAVVLTLSAGPEAQGQALDRAVETAKRLAARGEHVLLAIDTLDGVGPHVARRALGAARNVPDGGSLTVIATAKHPFGGETTVIALDVLRTSTGRLPALDLLASGTLKAELLVGEVSAAEILKARAEAATSG